MIDSTLAQNDASSHPPLDSTARCAVHPARPAASLCPVCAAPRCAADAAEEQRLGGCQSCAAQAPVVPAGPPSRAMLLTGLVRAALAATAICLIGGAIGLEYVGAQYFSVVWPGIVGLACGAVAVTVGKPFPPVPLRFMAAGYGAISALYGFRFAADPWGPPGRWAPPVVAAVVGAVFLPGLVLTPKKKNTPALSAGTEPQRRRRGIRR